MSQRFERVSERLADAELSLDSLKEVYHVPVLAALMAFMLWVRVRSWKAFVDGEQVLFSGNDAWYHFRMVRYTVAEFPQTMPFDPWTHFPVGTSVGQFGTLFDQLIALAALVVGLGSPTEKQIAMTVLFAPAVFGTLVVLPAYVIGRRLGGRLGGLVGVLILALTPGQFLTRSLVGFADHQVGEMLFSTVAVALILVALGVAMRDRPIYELFTTRDWDALRPTVLWSVAAGAALGAYIWVWPPGVLFVGILGIALVLTMLFHYVRDVSPDHVAIVGAVISLTTALLAAYPVNVLGLSATQYSLAQPGVALAVVLACVVVAAGARLWNRRALPRLYYPTALVVGGVAVVGVLWVAVPDLVGFFLNQVTRVVGLGATATAQTVAEATPVRNPLQFVYDAYGLAFYTAAVGFLLLLWTALREDEPDAEKVFVLVWAVMVTLAMLTQRRFDYYAVVAFAALNAYLVSVVFSFIDLDRAIDDLRDIETYQVLVVLSVILIVVAPLAVRPVNADNDPQQEYVNPAMFSAERNAPGSIQNWESSLAWLNESTPREGAYGKPSGQAGDHLRYYGTYPRQEDFQYQDGEYGVLAWWDYGHWITTLGHRIPNANPFQQGANEAANVLLAPNETYANAQMVNEDGEETRYVMIDYQLGLAGTRKFSAPAAWEQAHGVDSSDLSRLVRNQRGQGLYGVHAQRSYESLRVRLYQFHGSARVPQPIVVDWSTRTIQGRQFYFVPQDQRPIKRFDNMSAAREFVRQDGSSQVGGLLGIPSERVPALEHYRLVHASEETAETPISRLYPQAIRTQPWVKTFERVPGAEIRGTGPANATVTARVRMNMTTLNQTFTYVQTAETDENGEFNMTLPYSTTGYENFGPENGRTNVSVRATGPYTFSKPIEFDPETGNATRWSATVNVSEASVIGVDDDPIRVEMNEQVFSSDDSSDGNESGTGNETDAANTTATPSGNTSSTENTSSELRAPRARSG